MAKFGLPLILRLQPRLWPFIWHPETTRVVVVMIFLLSRCASRPKIVRFLHSDIFSTSSQCNVYFWISSPCRLWALGTKESKPEKNRHRVFFHIIWKWEQKLLLLLLHGPSANVHISTHWVVVQLLANYTHICNSCMLPVAGYQVVSPQLFGVLFLASRRAVYHKIAIKQFSQFSLGFRWIWMNQRSYACIS